MSNAREFILENSKEHSEAIDHGYYIKMDEPEILEWMEKYAQFKLKNNGDLGDVSGSTFTNEELKTIKIDILHIYDKVSLPETEVHKRNLILNKLKNLLGDEYYR